MRFLHRLRRKLLDRLGGREQVRVIVLMALVLSLDTADAGVIGGMGMVLQRSLGIGKAELGLLFTVESAAAAVGTILFGWLVDRTNRIRLLTIVAALWGVMTILCGVSSSYAFLLVTQAALGLVVSAAMPVVASLVGDFFQPEVRAKVYGFILSGEMLGAALALLISALVAGISWRLGFWILALPAPFLAWAIHRLPEPERGGASWISPSQQGASAARGIGELAREAGFEPRARLVRAEDPSKQSFFQAFRYVLGIPSNIILIISSALGYYFFGGLRIFALELLRSRYHLSHTGAIVAAAIAGSGAILGVSTGGRSADGLLARGHVRARIWIASCSYLVSSAMFLFGLLSSGLVLAMIFYFLGSFALGAVNPPLDAARLDIMHPRLWGRAEGVRMMVRKVAEAFAALFFGYVAEHVFGGGPSSLRSTFLLMLIPLCMGGLISVLALRTYPRDAASADAFAKRTREQPR